MWAAAKGAGAPDAVAVLEYSAGTKSIMTPLPEGVVGWTLEITGTDYKYRIDDATCQLLP